MIVRRNIALAFFSVVAINQIFPRRRCKNIKFLNSNIIWGRISDFGFRIWDFGFRILDFGFWIWDLGFVPKPACPQYHLYWWVNVQADRYPSAQVPKCPSAQVPSTKTQDQNIRLHGHNCRINELSNCQIAELSNCRIAELSNCRIVELSNCRIVELPNCRIAELPNCRIVKFLKSAIRNPKSITSFTIITTPPPIHLHRFLPLQTNVIQKCRSGQ